MHTTLFSTQCHCSTASFRCTAIHTIQHTVPLQHSKLSLYSTLHYSADSATVAKQTIAVLHTTLFSRKCHCSTAIYRCTANRIIHQTVPMYHSKLTLYCTPYYSADSATVAQNTFAELHIKLFSRQFHCSTAKYRCTTHHIIQQTVPL